MQLCGDRVFTVLYGKSRAFRRFLRANCLCPQKLVLNVRKPEMNRARVTIIRSSNHSDFAHDTFKELFLCLVLHRLELSNPSAEIDHPVRPPLQFIRILESRE
ncbi:MAG: hypothetical protein RL077_4742 [Verrucomicrobiota bacterium]